MGVTAKHIAKPSKENYPKRIVQTTYLNHNRVVVDTQHPTNVLHIQANQHKTIMDRDRVDTCLCHVMCEATNLPDSMIKDPKGKVLTDLDLGCPLHIGSIWLITVNPWARDAYKVI